MRKSVAAALALIMPYQALAGAACERPQDAMAIHTAALQQEMMVAALICHQVAAYNEFVVSHQSALQESDNGNYDKSRAILKDAKQYMSKQMEQVQASPEMRRQTEVMDKYDDELRSAESKSDEEKKEMQKSGKYDNYNSRKKNQ